MKLFTKVRSAAFFSVARFQRKFSVKAGLI